jgi:hypothetical protein
MAVDPILTDTWSSGINYIAHILDILLGALHALTLLPPAAVAALYLVLETAVYSVLHRHGVAPSPVLWGCYYLLNMALPHLLILYMGTAEQAAERQSKASKGRTAAARLGGGTEVQLTGAEKESKLQVKQRGAEQDLAAVHQAQQQQQQQQHLTAQVRNACSGLESPLSPHLPCDTIMD